MPAEADTALERDPLWFKDAIIYELHVRAFCDSNGDGIGDFKGLTSQLDYLQDLGVTALWLLPFCPSPLKDDGYDTSGYTGIHENYGSLRDFKRFIKEAHSRGLRVITELVLNHTSDQHPWFQRARRAGPGTRWGDFYVWSDDPARYSEARVIFQDFEASNWSWDPVAKAYYWHRFYSHQPDLNYDHPAVRKEMFKVLDFWLGLGVDGLRLDAVPYLFEREGTNCENLAETHAFLKEIRAHLDRNYQDRMLLAEANQWPEDAAAYFGQGDECHMNFHFPIMPRLFMSLRMEDRFPILDILDQTPSIPGNCQWAIFLRNHDELTLEMVTDEERDYMRRVYASDTRMRINLGIRRRLAPLLGNHRRRIELMNSLLLSLPGTPVIYYGDEIGMGDNVFLGDRNGVRTPMQWSPDRNAGFSQANPQRLFLPVIVDPEYHFETVNVEAQLGNRSSLLWWMKRLIALRKNHRALSRGSLEFLYPENHKVLAFLRREGEEIILVVANLSRFIQGVELDLSALAGMVPVEVFGRTELPAITAKPYFLSLGPHDFYWFSLERPGEAAHPARAGRLEDLPALEADRRWTQIFGDQAAPGLSRALSGYLQSARWFRSKAKKIKGLVLQDLVPISSRTSTSYLALVKTDFTEGDPETYVLPLALAEGREMEDLLTRSPRAAVAGLWLKSKEKPGLLYDASFSRDFCRALLEILSRRRRIKGLKGTLITEPAGLIRSDQAGAESLKPSLMKAEQSNTGVVFGDKFILKLFRRLDQGVNPDLEIGRFLTGRGFKGSPALAGAMEYSAPGQEKATLTILHRFVPNQGDAWTYALGALESYFETALAARGEAPPPPEEGGGPMALLDLEPPLEFTGWAGPFLEAVRLLGRRTAELHLTLASDPQDESFAPEPFTRLYQRSLYQSMRGLTGQVFRLLAQKLGDLDLSLRPRAEEVLGLQERCLTRFKALLGGRIEGSRIRCHGDLHLGQVLHTGSDFAIIDFEGEPARTIGERRIKRSPLRDVAGMVRSFHYAARTSQAFQLKKGLGKGHQSELTRLGRLWSCWTSAAFLKAYLVTIEPGRLLPPGEPEQRILLDSYLLDKAIYELGYELNNRPQWVEIPLEGIQQVLA